MKPLSQILAVFLYLAVQTPAAFCDPRSEVQKSYDKMSRAVKLKYVDGILAVRTADYERRGLSGEIIQDATERTLLQAMFSRALTLRQDVKIVDFRPVGPSKFSCKVQIHTEMVMPATIPKPPQTVEVDSLCQDVWVQTRNGWRIQSDRLVQETVRQSTQPKAGMATPMPSSSPQP